MKYFYVSPTGNGDGSSPVNAGSLLAGKSFVQANSTTDDVTIYLTGGRYSLTAPMSFGLADSGQNGHLVTWRGYLGVPEISGGITLTDWQLHDAGKNIWKASIPLGNMAHTLYVNGVRSKSPDILIDNAWGNTIPASAGVPPITSLARSFWKFKTLPWTDNSQRIVGYNYSAGVHTFNIADDGFAEAQSLAWWGGYGAIEQRLVHVYEALSQGAAYVDGVNGYAYYIPKTGEDMLTVDVVLPVLTQVIIVNGATNLSFYGVNFAHTDWAYQIGNQYMEQQASYYYTCNQALPYYRDGLDIPDAENIAVPAAVEVSYSNSVEFNFCTFSHMGGRGVSLSDGSHYCVINHCTATDTTANGVSIGGIVHEEATAGQTYETIGCGITNSEIYRAGIEIYGSVGIFLGYTRYCVVNHNSVYHIPYTGISVGWGWGRAGSSDAGNNTVSYNAVHDIADVSATDGGSIYTLGLQYGTIISNNYVWDLGTDKTNCLYMDEGTAGIVVNDNVCIKTTSALTGGAWIGGNSQTDVTATGNFALTGMKAYYGGGWFRYESPSVPWNNIPLNSGLHEATFLASATQNTWPTAAQNIVIAAGFTPVVVANTAVTNTSSATITGSRQAGITIQGVSGAAFGAVSYPTSTTWNMEVSNLSTGDNTITVQALDGSTVVGAASAVITYSSGVSETASIGQAAATGAAAPAVAAYTQYVTASTASANAVGRAQALTALTVGQAVVASASGIGSATAISASAIRYVAAEVASANASGRASPLTAVAASPLVAVAVLKGVNGAVYPMYTVTGQAGFKLPT